MVSGSNSHSSSEHPSTYVVQDRSNEEEMKRLWLQDQLASLILGSGLPEQVDPASFKSVLDVACGTGGWLIELAKNYPSITHLVGAEVSERMVEFAREQAHAAGVDDRVEFRQMDALRMLEFPDASFDLVNQRFAMVYLRTWDWDKLLKEFRRVLRPGGTIRLTEGDLSSDSSSPALMQLFQMLALSLFNSGHIFKRGQIGIADELERLLKRYGGGLLDIQTRVKRLHYQADEPAGALYAKDMQHAFHTMIPFLRKWIKLPEDYDEIYQRMVQESDQPDFFANTHAIVAWGTAPALDESVL